MSFAGRSSGAVMGLLECGAVEPGFEVRLGPPPCGDDDFLSVLFPPQLECQESRLGVDLSSAIPKGGDNFVRVRWGVDRDPIDEEPRHGSASTHELLA